MPSRQIAEQMVQEKRDRLLVQTATKGYSHFSGILITSEGKQFELKDGMI